MQRLSQRIDRCLCLRCLRRSSLTVCDGRFFNSIEAFVQLCCFLVHVILQYETLPYIAVAATFAKSNSFSDKPDSTHHVALKLRQRHKSLHQVHHFVQRGFEIFDL
jgi:hypothetical protein